MRLGPIVLKLRLAETRFENRIAGAAELAYALRGTLQAEMAFVIQLGETASANALDSGINQKIAERFGIIVMLANDVSDKDKTGLTAYDSLFEVRAELLRALLGWQIPGTESLVSYGGGSVLGINRAQFWYQFEFEAMTRIDDDDGVDVGAAELEDFDRIYAQWALIGPQGREFVSWEEFFGPGAFRKGFGLGFDVRGLEPLDMGSIVDFTDDPRDGAFGPGFGIKFDVLTR